MIRSFANRGTEDTFNGVSSKSSRRICPDEIRRVAQRKLDQINQAARLDDLRAPPASRLEYLRGNRQGQHSIRVNDQYRIYFRWRDRGPEDVEIVDYHN